MKSGIILTTFNDLDMGKPSFESLMTTDGAALIVVVDCNSTDDTLEYFQKQLGKNVIENKKYITLTQALNQGIEFLLRENCDAVGWWHPDMLVVKGHEDWRKKLEEYLDQYPECGKISSENPAFQVREERPGQEQCFLVRSEILKKLKEKDGYYFDENFVGIGGREDWDINKRILDLGYTVMITPTSQVWHKGMQTRSRRDTRNEMFANADYYFKKWGQYDPFV